MLSFSQWKKNTEIQDVIPSDLLIGATLSTSTSRTRGLVNFSEHGFTELATKKQGEFTKPADWGSWRPSSDTFHIAQYL